MKQITPGLYCSEDGKTVVEVIGFFVGSRDFVMFNQLFPTKSKKFRVDPTKPMFLIPNRFASLYPTKVVGCHVDFGDGGQRRTVKLNGIYCTSIGRVCVRVIHKSWGQGDGGDAEFIMYRQLYPTYGKVGSRPKSLFLERYMAQVTGCVVE